MRTGFSAGNFQTELWVTCGHLQKLRKVFCTEERASAKSLRKDAPVCKDRKKVKMLELSEWRGTQLRVEKQTSLLGLCPGTGNVQSAVWRSWWKLMVLETALVSSHTILFDLYMNLL